MERRHPLCNCAGHSGRLAALAWHRPGPPQWGRQCLASILENPRIGKEVHKKASAIGSFAPILTYSCANKLRELGCGHPCAQEHPQAACQVRHCKNRVKSGLAHGVGLTPLGPTRTLAGARRAIVRILRKSTFEWFEVTQRDTQFDGIAPKSLGLVSISALPPLLLHGCKIVDGKCFLEQPALCLLLPGTCMTARLTLDAGLLGLCNVVTDKKHVSQ